MALALFSCEKEEEITKPVSPGSNLALKDSIVVRKSSSLKSSCDTCTCILIDVFQYATYKKVYNKTNGTTWETSIPEWTTGELYYEGVMYRGTAYLQYWFLYSLIKVEDNPYVRIETYYSCAVYTGWACPE